MIDAMLAGLSVFLFTFAAAITILADRTRHQNTRLRLWLRYSHAALANAAVCCTRCKGLGETSNDSPFTGKAMKPCPVCSRWRQLLREAEAERWVSL